MKNGFYLNLKVFCILKIPDFTFSLKVQIDNIIKGTFLLYHNSNFFIIYCKNLVV